MENCCFSVICYLIIFAHEDLELDCFGNIVTSLGIKKMEIVRIVPFSNIVKILKNAIIYILFNSIAVPDFLLYTPQHVDSRGVE